MTRSGYKYYINLKPGKYHHLASTLMLAFYIGSAARYKPTLTQKIMQSEMRPILTEAVDTSPNQFIYQIASFMTQNIVAVPQAKL